MRSPWGLLVGGVIGIAIGISVAEVPRRCDGAAVDSKVGRLGAIAAQIDASASTIQHAVDALIDSGNSHLSVHRERESDTSTQFREVVPKSEAEPSRSESAAQSDRLPCSAWVTVLQKPVAEILVEYGKTPFDAGVARFVREAQAGLSQLESEKSRELVKLRKEHKDGSQDLNDAIERASQTWSERYTQILSGLREGMVSLDKSPGR